MPAKLKFRVVHCSTEDPEFPSTELNAHSPHTVGWQSARFCDYPQEIGFQFAGPVHLMQLQVLSHQYKIASKLELFVGTCPDGDKLSYQKCKWKRLGYLSLDNNERSSWQARELKSVQLDAYGRFLKIVSHSCHANKLNMYSQIGLIAINLIGDAASPAAAGQAQSALQASPAGAAGAAPPGGAAAAGRKEISALDDLTFDLNFDPATAAQIRELHVAKERAVRAEDYDAAKRLKEAMERLKQVGARMAKLELRKKAAVDHEDYDTAKLIKAEMDKLRAGLSYGSDHHGGDGGGMGAGNGAARMGGHRPANVMVHEEDVQGGYPHGRAEGHAESPYVKNPFGNKSAFGGGAPGPGPGGGGGASGPAHSAHQNSPPPAHNQAYSPQQQGGGGAYEAGDGYQTPARRGDAGGQMRASSQSLYPPSAQDPEGGGNHPMGAQGVGALASSPYDIQHHAGGSPGGGGGGGGGGRFVDDSQRDPETGMIQGPRRIVDPDAREARPAVAAAGGAVTDSTDLSNNDKAKLAREKNGEGPGPPEELTGAAIAEGEPISELFGETVARQILSKHFQHRCKGLEDIQANLNASNVSKAARVVANVVKKAVADKNPTVVLACLQLMRALLQLDDDQGRKMEAKGLLDAALQGTVLKLAEANTRVREESANTLMFLAGLPGAGCAWVAQALLKPPKQQQNFKAIQSRLEFLKELIESYSPAAQNGLSLQAVMPMLLLGANSSNAATRTVAIDVWGRLYSTYGREMDAHLKSVESTKTQDLIRAGVGGGEAPAAPKAKAPPPAAAAKKPAAAGGGSAVKAKPSVSAGQKGAGAGDKANSMLDDVEPSDDVERVAWYLKKAQAGDADAQYNLAICYDEGKGTSKDEKQAAHWYAQAAEQGDADAQFSLGVCYHEGKGVEKDDEKAIELWTKAANQDNEDAQFILGWKDGGAADKA